MPKANPQPPSPDPAASLSPAGFTLLESLLIVVIVAILALIGIPTFQGVLEQRRINATQFLIYQALRSTQQDGAQQLQAQQFSLRERNGRLEWASHPVAIAPNQVNLWLPLIDGVGLAEEDNTLPESNGVYYVRFSPQGDVTYRLGTITLVGSGGRLSHRCIIVSTLLGELRQGQGHLKPKDQRYCY